MDIQIKKPKFGVLLSTIVILVILGLVALLFLYMVGPRESSLTVTKEYCEQYFDEDDYLGVSTDRLNGQPNYKFQLCYEDYFWPSNKNWESLEKIIINDEPPHSVTLRDEPKEQEMRTIAKQLEQRGLKLWNLAELRMAYGAPGQHDYRKWEGYPFIVNDEYQVDTYLETAKYEMPPQNLYPGMPNMNTIPDGIYTAEAEQVTKKPTEVGAYNNAPVKTSSTDRSKTILLIVQVKDGQPNSVLAKYEIPKPQIETKPYGPYLVQLASDKWLRFNSDLTLCETINVEQSNGTYEFVVGTCPF